MKRVHHITKALFAGALLLTIVSCSKKETEETVPTTSTTELKKQVVSNYAEIVYASYSDAVIKAHDLKTALETFVASPTQNNLNDARQAYINAREPYGQTDAFRFYNGPIDDVSGKEGLMNGWPLDENYIDYTVGMPNAGIIQDSVNYPVISPEVLESLNEVGGETNLSTGYHAIEFLLWGQDFNADGPGDRPYSDYTIGFADFAQRRGQYLLALVDLLIDDLEFTQAAWSPNANNYRKNFVAQDPNVSLQLILTGIGKFTKGELYGERMSTAYDSRDQEDEHSCFSDQTHRDFILGQKGILNVFYGKYVRSNGSTISGKGLFDLLTVVNGTVATAAKTAMTNAETKVAAIHPPFDQEIIDDANGRPRVLSAIQAGNAQADQISAMAQALGLTVSL